MPEYHYYVAITKTESETNTEITGKLTCCFCEYDTSSNSHFPQEKSFSLEFNPLTVLDDLRNREKTYEYPNERLNINRSWKYLSGSYKYEYGFGRPLYIGNDAQYLKFVSNLDKIMRDNQCQTLQGLEQIQKQYCLNLNCNILVEEKNVFFDLLQQKNYNAIETVYKPLEYKSGKTNEEIEKRTYLDKNHKFSYHCPTMADVIFSILHFIVMHQYKFKTCALCKKRYAKIPNHGQGKYCSRKSPLSLNKYFDNRTNEKLNNLSCQASMSKFREIIRNKKKNKLRCATTYEQENHFIEEFNKYDDKIKESPTINNLVELYLFLKQYKFNT